jgi:aminoglycoside phosphotransferase (APT) family kinase protein
MNVIVTASGPVVIDWTNAARADALVDVAMTIVLLTCPRMPGSRIVDVAATPLRTYLARAFSARYRGRALDEQLDFVGRMKALDGNMTAEEVVACERLAARARKRITRS